MARMKNKYKPYIRKINGKEHAEDLRTAMRLAIFELVGGYVMVQRGFPNKAIAVGNSKQEIKDQMVFNGSWKEWQKRVQSFGELKT